MLCADAASRADCSKVRFGAVALDEAGGVLGAGWNHIPDGAASCSTDCVGGIRKGVRSGTMLERCYAIHAEQHALLNAGGTAHRVVVLGFLPDGSRFDNGGGFYCTLCARIMRAAGVQVVTVWAGGAWRDVSIEAAWEQSYGLAVG